MTNTKLADALSRNDECAEVEFKSAFDTSKLGDWLEVIKDILALSNSGGGILIIGL